MWALFHLQCVVTYCRWRVSLQTGHREKEASCAACLRLFQVRASVPCGTTPSLLLCVRFLTVDTPTRAIWPAYELHHLPCTAVFWAKLVGQ